MYVKLKNGAVEKYPYSITDLRRDNSSVSIPADPNEETLILFGVYPVAETAPPAITFKERLVEQNPVKDGLIWRQVWSVEDSDLEAHVAMIKATATSGVRSKLNAFAATRGYDSIESACSYAVSTNPKFKAEGMYCAAIRDAMWLKLFDILSAIDKGSRPLPASFAAIESEFPSMVWPN